LASAGGKSVRHREGEKKYSLFTPVRRGEGTTTSPLNKKVLKRRRPIKQKGKERGGQSWGMKKRREYEEETPM